MNVKVGRNRYYRKQVVDDNINLKPTFKDLPVDSDTTFKLQNGTDVNFTVMSGSIPSEATYGAGRLVGGFLSLYNDAVDTATNRSVPEIAAYLMSKDVTLKEGGFSLAHSSGSTSNDEVGQFVSVYTSTANPDRTYLTEEFEGDVENFESITRVIGSSVYRLQNPKISFNDFLQVLEDEGITVDAEGAVLAAWACIAARRGLIGDSLSENDRAIATAPTFKLAVTQNIRNQTWTFSMDGIPDMYVKTSGMALFQKEFSIKKYRHYFEYDDMAGTPANLDANAEASKGNTIFDDFYATRDFSNPYVSTTTDPVISTTMELSTEKAKNGGQSLRMYHLWDYAADNPKIQNQISVSGNLNPQMMRTSLYNIPYPIQYEIGNSTLTADDNLQMYGSLKSIVPEVKLAMNITKLGPNVPLNIKSGSNYTGARALTNLNNTNYTGAAGDTTRDKFSNKEATFLRSIVVTFSNYKPQTKHTSLDKFLKHGLDNFYGKGTGIQGTNERIVGGVVFTRFGIDGKTDTGQGENCYAYPLPVLEASQVPVSTSFTNASGGMMEAIGKSNLDNLDTMIWGVPNTDPDNFSSATTIRGVQLPMNSFFNARFFIDVDQYNTTGSIANNVYSGTQAYSDKEFRGSTMRVIFETDSEDGEEDGQLLNPSLQDLPFLDIPFPQFAGSSKYNFNKTLDGNQEYYPKHMTIWVQNYPWVAGNSGSTDDFFYGDQIVQSDGAAKEVELFIDSVELRNFGPQVENISPGNQTGILNFKPINHLSPINMLLSGTAGSPATFKKSWVGSKQLNRKATCEILDAGSGTGTTVRILNTSNSGEGQLSTYDLQNAGPVTVVGSGVPGSTTISSITDAQRFVLSAASTASTSVELTFTSSGTLEPSVNRAEYYQYNSGYNVILGFDDKGYLPTSASSHASDMSGFMLLNDFTTNNYTSMIANPLTPTKMGATNPARGGAIISQDTSLNTAYNQYIGASLQATPYFVTGGTDLSTISGTAFNVDVAGNPVGNSISLGGGTNNFMSADQFTQKGFMFVSVSGTSAAGDPAESKWGRRENPMCSAKIVNIPVVANTDSDNSNDLSLNQIVVDNPSIFNQNNPNERYIIYRAGYLRFNAFYKQDLKLQSNLPVRNNIISFTEDLTLAEDNKTPLLTEANLSELYISPWKYWISMMFDTPSSTIPRTYGPMCTVQETPSSGSLSVLSGSTYNEYTYTYDVADVASRGASSTYQRLWNLTPSPDNQSLVLDKDFGFGVYNGEDDSGGEVFKAPAFYKNYNAYPLTDYVQTMRPAPEDTVPLLLRLSNNQSSDYSATFFSDDYTTDTTKKPTLYWEYEDIPPVITNFTVQPAYNLLDKNATLYDLTTENLNAIKFTWEENENDDVWYRMLLVDKEPIKDKYHGCVMWVPLNESVTDLSATPTYTVHNPSASTSGACTVGSDIKAVIEGQGGFAPKIANTTTNGEIKVPVGTNTGLKDLDDFTLVLHVTFSAADKDSNVIVCGQTTDVTSSHTTGFHMTKGSDNKINVKLATTTLSSNSTVVCDGVTPTSIILTKKKDPVGPYRGKLYVNGVLEKAKVAPSSNVTNTADFIIGGPRVATGTIDTTTGLIEEVLIYNKCYDVVSTSNEYIYNTVEIEELDSTTNNYTHSALLVAADYHNFRGTSKGTIGMSSPTTWRTTTV